MSACGVVLRQQSSAEVTYELNPNVALPAEVLPLSEEAKRREDELRWVGLHESTAQEIIRLFDPDGEHPLGYKRTSLQTSGPRAADRCRRSPGRRTQLDPRG